MALLPNNSGVSPGGAAVLDLDLSLCQMITRVAGLSLNPIPNSLTANVSLYEAFAVKAV